MGEATESKEESGCKRDSVIRDHSSRLIVADALKRHYPEAGTSRTLEAPPEDDTPLPLYLALLLLGFTKPESYLSAGEALTSPFHPYPCGRFSFLWHFPPVARSRR